MSIVGRLVRAATAKPWRGERCDTLLYAADVDRSLVVDGRRFAPILDSWWLLHRGGEEALTIAPIGSELTGSRAFGRVVAPSLSATLGDLAAAVLDTVAGGDRRQAWTKSNYRRVVAGSGCKRVVGIQPPDPLVEACRELAIPVFDLQHGVFGARNGYYERLGRHASWLRFLVWDEAARDTLVEELGVSDSRIEVVGHPWLDLYRDPPPALRAFVEADRERARASLPSEKAGPVILVTLQWSMNELHPADFDNPSLPRGLGEAIAECPDATWWVRPHPMHAGSRPLGGDNIRWCDPRTISLPAALCLADGHVTWDSSAVIEAVLRGVPSLILSPGAHVEKDMSGAIVRPPPEARPVFERYRSTGLVAWARRDSRVADILAFARGLRKAS